jgi:prevent-host-death family protein
MTYVTLEEAGAQLPRLIEEARQGEEVIITRDDQPVARVVAVSEPESKSRPRRKPGSAKDVILYMADDFDAPLEDFKEYME